MKLLLRRRAFLSLLAASAIPANGDKGEVFPSEFRRYPDPATELEVLRLTNPKIASFLPAYYQRAVSRKGNFLLYSSYRTGSSQAFRMDLKTGESRQLTDARALDGATLSLFPDERSFCYFDGASLRVANLSHLREREICRVADGFERCPGSSLSDDGHYVVFGEKRDNTSRLRLATVAKGGVSTVAEAQWILSDPVIRPKRTQILYRQENAALWLVNFDGKQNRRLRIESGIGPARWTPAGKTIVYLRFPEDRTQLNTLREHTPDENADKLIGKTSQFVQFGQNGDSSVFVGASRNQSSPYVLLFLRLTRRELTLCEHRASDPAMVAPIFSPNSQNIFFQSDRDGKPAIYRIHVEKFVEETDEESG
ncbi:MAG: oligogalacturonate lyase family protein [Acidobacteriota bacterium]|nr:oligogalacturonate lyase family protein [Acidobacteriota bacterium]